MSKPIEVGVFVKFDTWEAVEEFSLAFNKYRPTLILERKLSSHVLRQTARLDRQKRLLKILSSVPSCTIRGLQKITGSTERTIRRDIAELAVRGEVRVQRHCGGIGGNYNLVELVA